MSYIENINSPADLKKLTLGELNILAEEMRHTLISKLSRHGGHCGPNLGMVEATIALHYVFNSPFDKLVFDVSHQSYCHKMLTGRAEAFLSEGHYDDVSGYTEPAESNHDQFIIGHTSTSVSLAGGLAKGRDLQGGHWNVIAIIGDGSLSGGEAMEGLNWASELGTNFIIIVNDNQMSIAENHGGLYQNLSELRNSNGKSPNNIFKTLGLDYKYVDEGNNIESLIKAFENVKGIDHPVVVHINTLKGKGFHLAETDKERWHWSAPFDTESGELTTQDSAETYDDITVPYLIKRMAEDHTICAITAGTPGLWGWLPEYRQKAGKQFVDVGIAEEHAVALASGIAKAGGKPVFGVCSSFIQRAYDQISQDLCINNNPATILVIWGSVSTMNDVTHLCHFDIPLLSGIPNLVYLAPTNKEEYLSMLEWSINYRKHPVAIRVPVGPTIHASRPILSNYSELNQYEVVEKGKQVAIFGLGNFYPLGEKVHKRLIEYGINATLINPRFISGIDYKLITEITADHSLAITIEDGALDGGFGEKIARAFGKTKVRTICYGVKKEFVDRYKLSEFIEHNRLREDLITADILKEL